MRTRGRVKQNPAGNLVALEREYNKTLQKRQKLKLQSKTSSRSAVNRRSHQDILALSTKLSRIKLQIRAVKTGVSSIIDSLLDILEELMPLHHSVAQLWLKGKALYRTRDNQQYLSSHDRAAALQIPICCFPADLFLHATDFNVKLRKDLSFLQTAVLTLDFIWFEEMMAQVSHHHEAGKDNIKGSITRIVRNSRTEVTHNTLLHLALYAYNDDIPSSRIRPFLNYFKNKVTKTQFAELVQTSNSFLETPIVSLRFYGMIESL